jgi:hypothetical protein
MQRNSTAKGWCQELDGRHCVYNRYTCGWCEAEGVFRNCRVWLFAGEGKASERSVGLLDLDRSDSAHGGDVEADATNAVLLAFRDSCERELTFRSRRDFQVVEFLLKFCVAKQETQRRAQVVEFLGLDALHLGRTTRPEPGVLAVEQEELTGGLSVVPFHAAGLEQQESAAFAARHA